MNKNTINKISGIISLILFGIIILGYISGNDSLLGFQNTITLYALMPSALIWFGTRRNGCGSCNQTGSISDQKEDKDIKNNQ